MVPFYDPSIATWLQFESEGMHLWNLNPPHVSAAFLPLTYLSVEHAYAIYAGLTFLALAVSAQIIVNTLGIRLTGKRLLLAGTFALAATPTLSFSTTGNLTGVVTLLVTLLWRAWRLGKWNELAILVGLACSLKVFFGLVLVYFALERRWKLLSLSTVTTLACFSTSVLVFGLHEHARWIEVTKAIQWPWLTINSSVVAPVARIAFMAGGQSVNDSATKTAMLVGEMVALPLVAAGLWAAFRSADRDVKALVLLLTILLTFPLGWLYYWWMLAGPLVACRKSPGRAGRIRRFSHRMARADVHDLAVEIHDLCTNGRIGLLLGNPLDVDRRHLSCAFECRASHILGRASVKRRLGSG